MQGEGAAGTERLTGERRREVGDADAAQELGRGARLARRSDGRLVLPPVVVLVATNADGGIVLVGVADLQRALLAVDLDEGQARVPDIEACLLYTSDAADE